MEGVWVDCKECRTLPPELHEYAAKKCSLCGALMCDECLDEAGYCAPCSLTRSYSKDEAVPV